MDKKISRLRNYNEILSRWLVLKQDNIDLLEWFKRKDYHTIAIYGMGSLGELFFNECKNGDIEIGYIVDKNADFLDKEIGVLQPDCEYAKVDVIVVTATHVFDKINGMLEEKVEFPIVSLEDIISNLYFNYEGDMG